VDIALVSVAAQSQLLDVAAAIASAEHEDLLVVDTSTVDPQTSAEARARLEEGSCRLLCAPVSGSTALARTGKLSAFCSGSEADYHSAGPVLDEIAGSHSFVGEGEVARTAKLIINLVVAGTLELLAEALALGEAGGLSRADAMDILGSSVIDSPFLRYKRAALVDADYEPTAALNLARKDLSLIAAAASKVDLELPVTDAVARVYETAAQLGLGDRDFAAVAEAIGR
jgi:3-hydroxyisobutyrate dehydrogenase-like beta-hydroxyacid dehydrogenase